MMDFLRDILSLPLLRWRPGAQNRSKTAGIFLPFGFLEPLGLDVIMGEKDMLRALRDAAEGWYNELTQPFLPILIGDTEGSVPSEEKRRLLASLANDLLRSC